MRASSAAGSSSKMVRERAYMPVFRAFWAEAALPAPVRGPVERWALRRFASICFWVAMGARFGSSDSMATGGFWRGWAVSDWEGSVNFGDWRVNVYRPIGSFSQRFG